LGSSNVSGVHLERQTLSPEFFFESHPQLACTPLSASHNKLVLLAATPNYLDAGKNYRTIYSPHFERIRAAFVSSVFLLQRV
jgi:hypothetical protein